MVHIIVEVSKYLMIVLFALYTYESLAVFRRHKSQIDVSDAFGCILGDAGGYRGIEIYRIVSDTVDSSGGNSALL